MTFDLSRELHRWKLRRTTAHPVDDALAEYVAETAAADERPVFHVRPYPGDGGVRSAISFLDDMHRIRRSRFGRDTSETHSFEIWHQTGSTGVVSFNVAPGVSEAESVHSQLMEDLPDSEVQVRDHPFPSLPKDGYVAAARSEFFRRSAFPIRHVNIDGFQDDANGSAERDPFKSLLPKVSQSEDVGVMVQSLFKPANAGIWEESRRERAANALRSTKTVTDWIRLKRYERDPTNVEKRAAEIIEAQQNKEQFAVSVRLLAWGAERDAVEARLRAVARALGEYYESHTQQGIAVKPVGVPTLGLVGGRRELQDVLGRAAGRKMRSPLIGTPGEKTAGVAELAGLVHFPGEGVENPKVDWSRAKAGGGVPPGTPRAKWDDLGVDPATATPEQKQVALLDADTDGVTWYGLGSRLGIEAGIDYPNITNPHKLVHGESGTGKTTLLAGDKSQQFRRAGGGLALDPTGDDTDEFLAEWPDDRPSLDLIYMDLSGDHKRIPRFNFLEIPDYLDPGTRQHTEFVEALAEDTLAMVGEAGGTDNYVGGLMKRVLKTVVRSMARLGLDATLFDVAVVCSAQENLSSFAAEMPEERLEYLRGRVRSLAEREDSELDPLAGRLDEWVLNENVRELICARNPTFSVHDAIDEGKEIVVRFSDSGSNTVKHMVGNALITRTYFGQRYHRPDVPFELVVDEAQSIITSASDIENIMDQGRKFGYRVTVACQRPKTQLTDDVRAAILGNARTTISFASGRTKESRAVADQHQGVDADDLVNLSPFTFYTSTETADRESTYAYQVDAFRAPREARIMAAEAAGDDSEATADEIEERVEALKDASLSHYGVTREEMDDTGSPYVAGGSSFEAAGDRQGTVDTVDQYTAAKAVHDAALSAGNEDGWIPLGDAVGRVRAYTDAESKDVNQLFRDVIQDVDRDLLDIHENDTVELRASGRTKSRIYSVGGSESGGGASHAVLLREAYEALTREGGRVTIVDQEGGTAPDGIVEAYEDGPVADLVGERGAYLEAECQTGSTKPGQTVRNLAAALEDGKRCLFVSREDVAPRVHQTLAEEPAFARTTPEGETERRFFNASKKLHIDGDVVCRPGSRESVWVDTGDGVVLRDGEGETHARFADADEILNQRAWADTPCVLVNDESAAPEGYVAVREPVFPPSDVDDDDWHILVVDDGEVSRYGDADEPDLSDVPERAVDLFLLIRDEADAPVTSGDVVELANEYEGDLDVDAADRTVRHWVKQLADAGALQSGDYRADEGREYEPVGNSL